MPTVDLDTQYGPRLAKQQKAQTYVSVKLFGREWRVVTQQNVFTALAGGGGDPQAILSLISNIVHPDERDDFRMTLMKQEGMDAPILLDILNSLTEVAAERPTSSPAGSSGGRRVTPAKRRTSAAK